MNSSLRLQAGRLLSLLAVVLLLTCTAQAREKTPDLGQLMEKSGLKSQALGEAGFLVRYETESGPDLDVLVVYWDETKEQILIFTTVVDREPGAEFSHKLLQKAMELNNDHPFAKFVLDPKYGDLDCQTELDLAGLTPKALAWHINWVASVGEKARGIFKDL
ncbi:MAG: YbjN domain-containing protein [Candidatus Xenobium sp.]|jgi:hypothetical protein|nr:CesT family type III secretion system chaperone [Burkholderiales bacterium]